jgi:hypothetical protein
MPKKKTRKSDPYNAEYLRKPTHFEVIMYLRSATERQGLVRCNRFHSFGSQFQSNFQQLSGECIPTLRFLYLVPSLTIHLPCNAISFSRHSSRSRSLREEGEFAADCSGYDCFDKHTLLEIIGCSQNPAFKQIKCVRFILE